MALFTTLCSGLLTLGAAIDSVPLGPLEDGLSDKEWQAIRQSIGDAAVVGIGETNHGSHDIAVAKIALVQSLVERHGAEILFIEASVGDGLALNAYAMGQRDDLRAILDNLPLWMFQTQEFESLMRWIRRHNQRTKKPLRVCGIEMQYVGRVLHRLRAETGAAAQAFGTFPVERIAGKVAPAKQFDFLWQPMDGDTLDAYWQLLRRLRGWLASKTGPKGPKRRAFAERLVRVVEQFTLAMAQSEEGSKHQLRDFHMFENLTWFRQHYGNPRAVLWAHNEHVWRREGNGGVDVLGRQLGKALGEDYFAIGVDFGRGAYRAPSAKGWVHTVGRAPADSLTAKLLRRGRPHAFTPVRGAAMRVFAETERLRTSAGGYAPYDDDGRLQEMSTMSVTDRYDAILSVATSSPSIALE
ncbi:MAG: erythromycin esterase family protein [Myxococcota bacterium]